MFRQSFSRVTMSQPTHPMRKTQLCIMLSDEATRRLEATAERFGMSRAALISIIAEEVSHVRPEAFFEALGAIPADLKTRPVGRPPGRKPAKIHAAQVAAV